MKKFFAVSAAILLCASLSFVGCAKAPKEAAPADAAAPAAEAAADAPAADAAAPAADAAAE